VKIFVSDFHLEFGEVGDPERNPIALALWGHTGDRWHVEGREARRMDPLQEDCIVRLNEFTSWRLDWFAKGGTVNPFEFDFPLEGT